MKSTNEKREEIVYSEPKEYFPREIRKKYKLGEFEKRSILNSIKAVMLGHAVGDALGVPVEFCTREELDKKPVTDMMGWGSYPVPEGCWSDDTSMALATLDSLKNGRVNYDEIMQNFTRWYTDNEYTPMGEMFDIGCICSAAINNYLQKENISALECGLSDEASNGNGSLMRIHPVALYLFTKEITDKKGIEIIHNASALTHAHPRAKIACGIYALILWELLKKPCRESLIKGLRNARRIYLGKKQTKNKIKNLLRESELSCEIKNELLEILYDGIEIKKDNFYQEHLVYDKMLKRLERVYNNGKNKYKTNEITCENIKSSGYVVDTLEAAIWCILTTKDYKDCVLKAVNLGDDTDTVAAVAGGLAGALYGLEAIPSNWLKKLRKLDYIENMCDEAYKKWIKVCE